MPKAGMVVLAVQFFIVAPALSQVLLTGRVIDEDGSPVGGARVTARPAEPSGGGLEALSGPTGFFALTLPRSGSYLFGASCQGYYALKDRPVEVKDAPHELTLVLNRVREVFQTLDVNATPSPVDLERTAQEEHLTGTEMVDVPFPSSHSVRNAMRLMPGVVEDPKGGVHFGGGAEYQTLYELEGFNITDPITGRFNTRLSMEGVQSLEWSTGRFSPEYGKGAAGALAVHTDSGTDTLRYSATNFIPGVDTRGGLHLGNWTPRVAVSGPIRKGRAWFADSLDAEYDVAIISDLPPGQNRRTGWGGSNLLHTQVNLTPANILFASFLVNRDHQSNFGLGPLDPIPTTTTQRTADWFVGVRDQVYLSHGTLLEFGFAENRVFHRQIPQGHEPYVIAPDGRSGNYFVDASQHANREQFLANAFLPVLHWLGEHRFKAGVDVNRLNYDAAFSRTSYDLIGLSGDLLSRTTFGGNGDFSLPNTEASSYLLDSWRVRENLQLDLGFRQDWDRLVGAVAFSPRLSFSLSPFGSTSTRIAGGYAITRDSNSLALFSRPLDQYAITTQFQPDGSAAFPPAPEIYTIDRRYLRAPRYGNWSASFDRRLSENMRASINYLRRRGSDGFTYVNAIAPGIPAPPPEVVAVPGTPLTGLFTLANQRRDEYDSIEVAFHRSFAEQHEVMASYTRSRAVSNAVLDLSIDQPLQVLNNAGPMPWDSPNRLLSWGYLPLPGKHWSWAYLVELRSGFPFSVQDEHGVVVGPVNSYRYPLNFDLNLHLEYRFVFRGYRLAIRVGFNNLTDHENPTAVNNTIGSAQFLQFFGSEGRHAVIRLRFFGKA